MWWLLIGLGIGMALWLFLKPAWAPKPNQVQSELAKSARLVGDQASKMYMGLGGWLKLRRDKTRLGAQFKSWATTSTLSDAAANANLAPAATELNAWLGTLSEKELQVFCAKVARFTAALGFDLAWLWDDQLRGQAELKHALEEAVALYSITAWRAQQVQAEVRVFIAWERWLAHPNKHRALGQKMYTAFVQNGSIRMDPALYVAPEKTRWAQMNRSIKEVAQAKPAMVSAVVRDIIYPRLAIPAQVPETPAQT